MGESRCCRVDTRGILGSDVRETEPQAGVGWGKSREPAGRGSRNFQKLIYWNFRSIEILRFPPPSPAPGVSAPTCFLSAEILPSARVGMGGKT